MNSLSPFEYTVLSVFAFFAGSCVGSFLNVCIYRIPREESLVWPNSHCPLCGKSIKPYHNIPILSYLMLRGKCAACGGRIRPRYLLVETLVAVLFLLVWLRYGMTWFTLIYWVAVSGLVLGTFVDFEHMIIPDRVSIGGIIFGLILSPIFPALHNVTTRLEGFVEAAIGVVVGGGILWVVGEIGRMVFKKDAMGFGDVKLLAGIGALLGWRAVLFTIVVSSFVGSIVGIGLILSRKTEWQGRIPYGPYIALAALIWILCGQDLWGAYVGWLSGTP